jgi:hypothetical protein
MLTAIERQAVIYCLNTLSTQALEEDLPLLAALIQTPVLDHPDPSAQYLGVRPLPVPEEICAHSDGPVAGLRQAAGDLRHSSVQAQLAAAPGDLQLLAWVFMHTDGSISSMPVRVIEAVDIDDLTYRHTRLPDEPAGGITVGNADPAGDSDTIAILRGLARSLRTD